MFSRPTIFTIPTQTGDGIISAGNRGWGAQNGGAAGLRSHFEDFLVALDHARSDEEIWAAALDAAGKVPLAGAIRVFYRDAAVEDAILPLAPASNPRTPSKTGTPACPRGWGHGADADRQLARQAQREAAGATVDEGR